MRFSTTQIRGRVFIYDFGGEEKNKTSRKIISLLIFQTITNFEHTKMAESTVQYSAVQYSTVEQKNYKSEYPHM